jgi:outer membrane immunogenic protein
MMKKEKELPGVMKKIALSLITAATICYSNFIYSETMNPINQKPNWTGFYLGGNAGYWRAQPNKMTTTGSVNYINPEFELGASNIAYALAQIADNHFSFHPNGLIGGGQAGYNYQLCKGIFLGLNIDFDGLTNSNNTDTLQKSVNLVDFDESYAGSLFVKQKIHYLGTVRARLGYLFYPTILVYVTGGFAYGHVTLNTTWTAQESLGSDVFPTIAAQHNSNKILTGWTGGAGIEWLFQPNWSTSLEYTYYKLNDDLHSSVTLSQVNLSTSPSSLWGSTVAKTDASVSVWTIRLGVNYHFS